MKYDLDSLIDAAVDGAYTGLAAFSGYMVGQGGLTWPSKAAWLAAGVTGAIGFLNHLRGLSKQSPPLVGLKPVIILAALLLGTPSALAQPAPNVLTRADVTVGSGATSLCPLNASRIDCSCTNNDGANAIRVGDVNVTSTRGQRVTAGATFKAATTGAVFGIAEGGAAAVSCTDQSR